MSSGYEIAKEKDIRELFDLQLRAFESEAEMIGSRNVPALMESLEENREGKPGGFQELDGACKAQ